MITDRQYLAVLYKSRYYCYIKYLFPEITGPQSFSLASLSLDSTLLILLSIIRIILYPNLRFIISLSSCQYLINMKYITNRNYKDNKVTVACKYKKEDVVWLPMRQLSTRDQMTQTLTTIGHRIAINNEQSQYRIVSYKRPRNDNVKQFKREK